MRITHVLRGDDHISNTPRQLLLYRALGAGAALFAHAPMILGPDRQAALQAPWRHRPSRRSATSAYVPEAMVNFLALLGWAYDGKQELFTLAELEKVFTLEKIGANPAVFDTQKLEWVNAQHLKRLDEAERVRRVSAFLEARGHDLSARGPEWRAAFVRALGDRLRTLADAETWGAFVLRDALEIEPDAWADLAARPGAGRTLAALAARLAADAECSLASLEAATRGLAAELGVQAGRGDHAGARRAHRAQGGARHLRGDVAARARALRGPARGRGGALERRVPAGAGARSAARPAAAPRLRSGAGCR